MDVTTTHHSIEVIAWNDDGDDGGGGVRVGNWADVDPTTGEPAPMLLLRNGDEVGEFLAAVAAVSNREAG